ncbi:MAG: hypothetical protein J7525_19815 [Roseofilum sp. SID3]|uniref:hypothetical protein n=1 Tax=Roseofilum sp. SID3 TaxID=2821499 RepID=UPI001B1EE52E|nr:hypothetical protein [Roseofilum sp. SID3]MBP0015344.1 hypothetical protein [Roseofilum sp. SID3]
MNQQLLTALKTHNQRRIAEYRDIAIELLEQIQDESQVELYFQACNALSSLQAYLDLSAEQYPVKESLTHQARNLWNVGKQKQSRADNCPVK